MLFWNRTMHHISHILISVVTINHSWYFAHSPHSVRVSANDREPLFQSSHEDSPHQGPLAALGRLSNTHYALPLSLSHIHALIHGDVSGWLLPWVPRAVFVPPRFPPPLQSCSSPCPLSLEIAIQLSAWLESFASWQGRKGGPPKPRGSERWMDRRRKNRTGLDLESNIGRGRAYMLFFSFFQRN